LQVPGNGATEAHKAALVMVSEGRPFVEPVDECRHILTRRIRALGAATIVLRGQLEAARRATMKPRQVATSRPN
jgi:hypothetical protein